MNLQNMGEVGFFGTFDAKTKSSIRGWNTSIEIRCGVKPLRSRKPQQ